MPELLLIGLALLWIHAPRLLFSKLQDSCESWKRESALRGVDDRRGQIFFQRLIKDANQLIRRGLFLWRLWLGRMITLVALCLAARFLLPGTSSQREDFILVLLGALLVGLCTWGVFQFLRMDSLRREVLVWARYIGMGEEETLPSLVRDGLRSFQEQEWESGTDQSELRWNYLEGVWGERSEALRGRQNTIEEWLPGVEMVAGCLLAGTWLCMPVLNVVATY